MTSVSSHEAKTHLGQLLSRVQQGEKILITRRGEPIAVLAPPPGESPDVPEVIRQMKALRQGNRLGDDLTIRELLDEGRRF